MLSSRFVVCMTIAAGLNGCSGMTAAHVSDNSTQIQMVQKDERENLWQDNKGWLLSKLPKTEPLVRDIQSALEGYPDAKYSCSGLSDAGCNKLLNLLRQKLSPYNLAQLPDGFGRVALIDGGYAYVFRMTDWTFSGIANLSTDIYFSVQDVPLRRTDERSFAFVPDNKTDSETVWTMYHRNIMDQGGNASPLGEYTLTRAELDAAGVPKQIDLLTLPQRNERELAKQGMVWRRRAQMKAIAMCSSKPDSGSGSRKPDGRGGRGKHTRTTSQESTSTGSTPGSATTMADALQGKAHLNCNAGSGYVVTEDGIAAEVYSLTRSKEGSDAVIAATAREIPGGVIRFNYPVGKERIDSMNPDAGKEMILQIETMDDNNKLNLNLSSDTGVTAGTLALTGNWYLGSGYRIRGKDISTNDFAAFFIRAYRDCAMRNSEGICKNIPDLFMSLQNPLIAAEFLQYISDHYLSDAAKGR